MVPEATVRVLRTFAEVEEIRPWWASWQGNPDADIDFYLSFFRAGTEVVRPHVIVIYRGGIPDAILVGRIDRKPMDFRIGYIRFGPKANILFFVAGALRGNPSFENNELFVREICRSLSRREADIAHLKLLRIDSDLFKLAKKIPGFARRDHFCAIQPHFTTTIPRSSEEFYRSLGPKTRQELRRKQQKLEKDISGPIRIRCFREVAEFDEAIAEAEEVAKKSYLRGLGVGFDVSPQTRAALRVKAQKGWLRTYVLYSGDRPLAFWMGDFLEGTFGGNFTGYDPDIARYSPGMYLMIKVIEDLCNSKEAEVTKIDFGPGGAPYKASLGKSEGDEASVHIFSWSLKGIELNLLRSLTTGIHEPLKKALEKAKLLAKIKRAWRNRAGQKARAVTQDGPVA
jgi:CelD/BcsL family acetyltransferase involved in cellulose biosynthesis